MHYNKRIVENNVTMFESKRYLDNFTSVTLAGQRDYLERSYRGSNYD